MGITRYKIFHIQRISGKVLIAIHDFTAIAFRKHSTIPNSFCHKFQGFVIILPVIVMFDRLS
jgi:hypothetical protein